MPPSTHHEVLAQSSLPLLPREQLVAGRLHSRTQLRQEVQLRRMLLLPLLLSCRRCAALDRSGRFSGRGAATTVDAAWQGLHISACAAFTRHRLNERRRGLQLGGKVGVQARLAGGEGSEALQQLPV